MSSKILRPGQVPPEFLPPQIPMIGVKDEQGETRQLVASAALVISPQVQQAIYQATRSACLDALKDFVVAMSRIMVAALDAQSALQEATDEKTEPAAEVEP